MFIHLHLCNIIKCDNFHKIVNELTWFTFNFPTTRGGGTVSVLPRLDHLLRLDDLSLS